MEIIELNYSPPKNELGLCEAELKLSSNTTDEEFRERYQKDYFNPDKL